MRVICLCAPSSSFEQLQPNIDSSKTHDLIAGHNLADVNVTSSSVKSKPGFMLSRIQTRTDYNKSVIAAK